MGQYCFACCRLSSSSVIVVFCNAGARAWEVGQPTMHSGPVRLRPVRVTHCWARQSTYTRLTVYEPWIQSHTHNKYVRLRGLTYIHTCRSYVHTPRDFTNGASLAWRLSQRISTVMFTSRWAWPARCPLGAILGFWGSKFTEMGDSLPWTPMNQCQLAHYSYLVV